MATVTRYVQGTGTGKAVGESGLKVYQTVVDVAQLYTDGYTASDTFKLFTLPVGFLVTAANIEIVSTLANVTNTSVGTTASGTDWVNAQTDTAVGRYTAYASNTPASLEANWRAKLVTSALGVYLTLGALGSTSAGKISFTIVGVDLTAKAPAKPHVYTNR